MKKTYIKPENTVVCLNAETLIAASADANQLFSTDKADVTDGVVVNQEAREVIQSRDVWEEW